MNFDKLQAEVDALIKKSAEPPVPAEKKMSAKDFGVYAKEQVDKAQADDKAGKKQRAEKRLTALRTELGKISKFEFKAGELPTVTVFKDEEQLDTTEEEVALKEQEPDGQSNYTAKASEFASELDKALDTLKGASNRPTDKDKKAEDKPEDKKEGESSAPPSIQTEDAWPEDLAKSIKPRERDKDADYDFGKDAGRKTA